MDPANRRALHVAAAFLTDYTGGVCGREAVRGGRAGLVADGHAALPGALVMQRCPVEKKAVFGTSTSEALVALESADSVGATASTAAERTANEREQTDAHLPQRRTQHRFLLMRVPVSQAPAQVVKLVRHVLASLAHGLQLDLHHGLGVASKTLVSPAAYI